MASETLRVADLIVGTPSGLAVGRIVWRLVTDRVPLDFIAPVVLIALVAVARMSIGVVNILALLPARRAARLHPATELRAEKGASTLD